MTGCLTRTFDDTVTVLSTEREPKQFLTVYADEVAVGQSCTESGFSR